MLWDIRVCNLKFKTKVFFVAQSANMVTVAVTFPRRCSSSYVLTRKNDGVMLFNDFVIFWYNLSKPMIKFLWILFYSDRLDIIILIECTLYKGFRHSWNFTISKYYHNTRITILWKSIKDILMLSLILATTISASLNTANKSLSIKKVKRLKGIMLKIKNVP